MQYMIWFDDKPCQNAIEASSASAALRRAKTWYPAQNGATRITIQAIFDSADRITAVWNCATRPHLPGRKGCWRH